MLAQSGRLDKGVWKPSAIAGAARPLFAACLHYCAPDPLPAISPPAWYCRKFGPLPIGLYYFYKLFNKKK